MAFVFTSDAAGSRRLFAAMLAAATLVGAFGSGTADAKESGRQAVKSQQTEQIADNRGRDRHRWTRDKRYRRDWGRHDNRRIVVPPRSHRRWAIGRPLPRDTRPYRYDHWAAHRLRRPPRGHYYARIDNDLLLIRIIDRAVIRLVFSF